MESKYFLNLLIINQYSTKDRKSHAISLVE